MIKSMILIFALTVSQVVAQSKQKKKAKIPR